MLLYISVLLILIISLSVPFSNSFLREPHLDCDPERSPDNCSLTSPLPPTLKQFVQDLYLIAPIFNPSQFKSRYDLYYKFEKYIKKYKVNMITIELIYEKDHGHFAVTSPSNPNHIQLKTQHPVWHRENLFNIAVRYLPPTWKYVMYIDADTAYVEEDWVQRIYEAFSQYEIVQLFKVLQHLGPRNEGQDGVFSRKAFERIGGLIDYSIVGHADSLMTDGFLRKDSYPPLGRYHPNFRIMVKRWQERASAFLDAGKIGYANLTIQHFYHGDTAHRGYTTRTQMLLDERYDPREDSFYDKQGVLQLNPTKEKLLERVEQYFSSRKEDSKSEPMSVVWVRSVEDMLKDIANLRELTDCVKAYFAGKL